MERVILVTYASKYGATKEIAGKIAEVLCQSGWQVSVLPVDGISDLTRYEAVVLGSAVYVGKWQKEAVKFIQANEKILADRLIWLFSSGPTGEGDAVELVEGVRLPPALEPVVERIHPRDVAVFHGYINPDKVNFVERWAIRSLVKKPFGDFRDWDAITTWATSIAETLKTAELSPS